MIYMRPDNLQPRLRIKGAVMLKKAICSFGVALNLFLLAAAFAQNDRGSTYIDYHQFMPKWSKGDSWSLECSELRVTSHIPTRQYHGRVMMTVEQTPVDGVGNYVISMNADDRMKRGGTWGNISDRKLFITLDPNDLSLLETKSVRYIDANEVTVDKYPGHKIQRIFVVSGIQVILPVLSPKNDKNTNYEVGGVFGTKASITSFEGEEALVVFCSYGREKTEEDIIKRVNEGPYNYRLLWEKGDLWWTRQTGLDENRYRLELIRSEPPLTDANSVEARFATLYSRYETAKAEGREIESGEICYDIVDLGKEAVPFIMDKIKEGDESLIGALSEITGFVSRDATIDKCLDWWERNKDTWNEYVERTKIRRN
jgi:hypothetical protein